MRIHGRMAPKSVTVVFLFVLATFAVGCSDSKKGTTADTAAFLDVANQALTSNELAPTPPMGFNNWNAFGCDVNEELIKETADALVATGLKDAGYVYVNIDDCWSVRDELDSDGNIVTPGRDAETGRLVPDPVKFPNGIKGVADYVHSLGLKLGIYGDAGTLTCAGYPGSLGHEDLDALTWAEWGVDYLKYDNCNNPNPDPDRADFVSRYTAMSEALDKTDRPIVYEMCEWGQSQPWEWAASIADLWRTGGDIFDSWASLKQIIANNIPLSEYAQPGHWNDPDMMEIGNGGMTAIEERTHMSMWAMLAAPLIIGTDLRPEALKPETLAILGNREIIAIDQDRLGIQGSLLSDDGGLMVLQKPLANGDVAIALYNSTDLLRVISVPIDQTSLPRAWAYRLNDAWSHRDIQAHDTIAAGVPAHGTVVYRVRPLWNPWQLAPSVSVGATSGIEITGTDIVTDGVLIPGTATIRSTVTNHGIGRAEHVKVKLELPAGWGIAGSSDTRSRALHTGASLESTWQIVVPDTVAAGQYEIPVTATYRWGYFRKEVAVTSQLVFTVIVAPSAGTHELGLMKQVISNNGLGPVEIDMNNGGEAANDGNLMAIGGKIYTRGIGTRAPSEVVYFLGGQCSKLTVEVGIDDDTPTGEAAFLVYADDQLVAQSELMTVGPATTLATQGLEGAHLLRIVTEPGDSDDGVHADWAMPRLTCGNSEEPVTKVLTLFSFEGVTDEERLAGWVPVNAIADGSGTLTPSQLFITDGEWGLEIIPPNSGNWFGTSFDPPVDLTGYTALKYDIQGVDVGSTAEIAVQVGPDRTWCQGGMWSWVGAGASRTVTRRIPEEMSCDPGSWGELHAIYLFLNSAGTNRIDNVRAEMSGE